MVILMVTNSVHILYLLLIYFYFYFPFRLNLDNLRMKYFAFNKLNAKKLDNNNYYITSNK